MRTKKEIERKIEVFHKKKAELDSIKKMFVKPKPKKIGLLLLLLFLTVLFINVFLFYTINEGKSFYTQNTIINEYPTKTVNNATIVNNYLEPEYSADCTKVSGDNWSSYVMHCQRV